MLMVTMCSSEWCMKYVSLTRMNGNIYLKWTEQKDIHNIKRSTKLLWHLVYHDTNTNSSTDDDDADGDDIRQASWEHILRRDVILPTTSRK